MTEPYEGRDQTLAKHYILKRYLQTLAFKLLEGGLPELTYVDGFSGPWQSKTSDYSDTSFMIALQVLKDAHQKYAASGRPKIVKCFFVEKDRKAYEELDRAVRGHHAPDAGFHVATFHGQFEDAVDEILRFIGRSFALVFIDPTGWTGYPFQRIGPVLAHQPGEVLINFMYDHINRFAASDDPAIVASLNPIFGGPDWKSRLDGSLPRGEAVEKLFREVLQTAGSFEHVLSTRVDKATADRPHFFIAYGTRKPAGLKAFRQVEYDALKGHEKRRTQAKLEKRTQRTGTGDLFAGVELEQDDSVDVLLAQNRSAARPWIEAHLKVCKAVRFLELWQAVLQRFMLRETDVKDLCVELGKEGIIRTPWVHEGKRKPHDHHVIASA